jgi:DNA-binding NtrC family response regulator
MEEAQVNPPVPKVVVVQLSEAFGDVWSWVVDELGDGVAVVNSHNGLPQGPDVAMVVLSAGAAERDALAWLESHALPDAVPAVVVGIDYGRRLPVQALRAGATDYFALPDDLPLVRSAISAAVERYRSANGRHRDGETGRDPFRDLIAESEVMRPVLDRAAWLARYANIPASIVGDAGTGKELLARAIHHAGDRRPFPFVVLDCCTLAEGLRVGLFGQVRDPSADVRPGLLEVAEGGTLFLRSANSMPTDVQAELARVLREGTTRREGGTREHPVDVRILLTYDDDPERLVERGELHRDLFFQTGAVTLRLPALRERDSDVLLIARALTGRIAREHRLQEPSISPDVEHFLLEHPWPGNVRELKTALVRALLLSPPGDLLLSPLRAAVGGAEPADVEPEALEANS